MLVSWIWTYHLSASSAAANLRHLADEQKANTIPKLTVDASTLPATILVSAERAMGAKSVVGIDSRIPKG